MPEEVNDWDQRALENELRALTARVVEKENQVVRADQSAAEVAAAVRDLSDQIRRQDRVLSLNSFVAYLIFTVLLCAAFLFLYRERTRAFDAERERALVARDSAQARADSAARELAARVTVDRAGAEVLELLRRRRYAEAIAAHRKLVDLELAPSQRQFLDDAVEGARAELATDAAARARQAYVEGEYERARHEAAEGLAYAAGATADDLRYFLAASLDRLGRAAEAAAAYKTFLAAAPDHDRAPRARDRLRQLAPGTE